ncbi:MULTISPECIES: hypothetical protein [Gammaproteobacteria]|uniref:hypothetical protein n=1 Tax=Gammaproteobacteria TaxID=1236 RepID=UPI003A8D9556
MKYIVSIDLFDEKDVISKMLKKMLMLLGGEERDKVKWEMDTERVMIQTFDDGSYECDLYNMLLSELKPDDKFTIHKKLDNGERLVEIKPK